MFRRNKYIHRVLPALPQAALCLLTLSACSDDDDTLTLSDTGKTPIELTVGIVGDGAPAATRSAGDPARTTRAVVTTDKPYNQLAAAFEKGTSLYMVMKSEDGGTTPGAPKYTRTIGYAQEKKNDNNTYVNFATNYVRYYEDSYSRNSQLSVYAACVPGYYLSGSVYTKPDEYVGNWPNGTEDATTWTFGGNTTYNNGWTTYDSSTIIDWPIDRAADDDVTSQTANFLSSQDLCFSNNVSKYVSGTEQGTNDPVYTDNRIKFNTSSRKFEGKRLVFYHALTMVTFKIKIGEGFENAEFAFTDNGQTTDSKNMVMVGFNTSGNFNVEQGEFTSTTTTAINKLYISEDNRSTNGRMYAYILDGLLVPGSDLNGNDKDETHTVHFEIDGNLYHVTKKQLADALATKTLSDGTTSALEAIGDQKLMRPGVHYVFEMTVGKRKMDHLTAAVVPWEEVNANETTPTNARIMLSFLTPEREKVTDDTPNIDLFRAVEKSETINDDFESFEWKTGYAPTDNPIINKAQLHETSTDGLYSAEETTDPNKAWYWPNNKTFYHFRMLSPKTTDTWKIASSTVGDYISLTGHVYSDTPADSYTDVWWGAPFKSTLSKVTYSTDSGFDNKGTGDKEEDHQISKAIGPTESTINIVMFHMLSDVTIQLTTPKTGDTDYDARVDIDGATLSFSDIYNNGLVRIGNGKVETTGYVASPAIGGTVDNTNHQWRYGFVPQSLESVKLTIQTTDHNLYVVDMKDVVATTIGANLIANPYKQQASGHNSGKYIIDYWYPNYKYTYTFKLTKSDISLITATLADWETVTAGDDNVQIK